MPVGFFTVTVGFFCAAEVGFEMGISFLAVDAGAFLTGGFCAAGVVRLGAAGALRAGVPPVILFTLGGVNVLGRVVRLPIFTSAG